MTPTPRAKVLVALVLTTSIIFFFCFYFQKSTIKMIPSNIDRILFPQSISSRGNSTKSSSNHSQLISTKFPVGVSTKRKTPSVTTQQMRTSSKTKQRTPTRKPRLNTSTAKPPPPTVPPKKVKRFLDSARGTTMTKQERHTYVQTLLAFDRIWRQKLGFDYQLYGGALLGAYRHSGFVDYDDDLDIIVSARFINSFASYFAGSNLTIKKQGWKRKVSFNNMKSKTRMTRFGWRWPFLDVFFQKQKNGVLTDPISSSYTVNVSEVYPNIRIPFEGHLFPVPRCIKKVLIKMYGEDCFTTFCTTPWDHKHERSHPGSMCLPYESLKNYFSINKWRRIDDSFMERTVLNAKSGSKPVRQRVFLPKCD